MNDDARRAAIEQLLKYRRASESYLDFVRTMYPHFTLPDFQVELINALDLLEKRALFVGSRSEPTRNLLVTMPPRHAKSSWGTINFPAYFLGRDPRRHVMSVSYNAILAKGFGRSVRTVMNEPMYRNIFPDSRIASDKRAADTFVTTDNGNYYSIGLNGTTTGRAANCLLIDDPVKSRVDAESKLIRDRVWDFYTGSLSNRREPEFSGAAPIQIVILTRWHPDDLAGRIMQTPEWEEGLWHHINFPAISEVPNTEPVQYRALWPERFSLTDLNREREKSERDFEALYQQNPQIMGGNLIRIDWFQQYDVPQDDYTSLIITADTAYQATSNSDYSVLCTMGLTRQGDIHVLDIQRGKWDFPTMKRIAISRTAALRGKGLRGLYIENRASGQSLIQELRNTSGMSVIPYNLANRDKIARVNVTLPLIEGGRVFIPQEAPWLDDFLRELAQFPSGVHDDMVDAFIMGVDILSRVGISADQLIDSTSMGNSLNSLLATSSDPLASKDKDIRRSPSLNGMIARGKAPRPLGH